MTSIDRDSPRRRASRLTPETVRRWQFTRTPLGRRGYLEADVDRFRLLVTEEIARADAEKAELRAELDRLRNYFRDHRIDPSARAANGSSGTSPEPAVNVQAVNVMSMAQQAADQHIAQAEHYARELVGDARRQYEQIVVTAHQQAQEAAREAARAAEASAAAGPLDAELQARITYLRTFADVTQVQVASILQALGRELDRLTVPGRLDPAERVSPPLPEPATDRPLVPAARPDPTESR